MYPESPHICDSYSVLPCLPCPWHFWWIWICYFVARPSMWVFCFLMVTLGLCIGKDAPGHSSTLFTLCLVQTLSIAFGSSFPCEDTGQGADQVPRSSKCQEMTLFPVLEDGEHRLSGETQVAWRGQQGWMTGTFSSFALDSRVWLDWSLPCVLPGIQWISRLRGPFLYDFMMPPWLCPEVFFAPAHPCSHYPSDQTW